VHGEGARSPPLASRISARESALARESDGEMSDEKANAYAGCTGCTCCTAAMKIPSTLAAETLVVYPTRSKRASERFSAKPLRFARTFYPTCSLRSTTPVRKREHCDSVNYVYKTFHKKTELHPVYCRGLRDLKVYERARARRDLSAARA